MTTGEILLLTTIIWPITAAAAGYAIGWKNERARDAFVFAAVVLELAVCILLALCFPDTELRLADHGGLAFHFRSGGFSSLYGCVTGFLWLVTTVFSSDYFVNFARSLNRNRYWLFNLLTLGATMGVFFSADLRTTFLFFEMTSLASYALVAHDESPDALRAAETYLAIAVIGGLVTLMGMLLLQQRAGTLEFTKLYEICADLRDKSPLYLPGALLTVGFGAKAGLFPLHIWLPKAHPVAPAPASALLSGILIKTGVFGVAAVSCNIFPGDWKWGAALLVFAAATMFLGALLAVFSNDLKRTLACSSVSQIGFIITGVGMQVLLGDQNSLAIRGTVLHMLNHSLFKFVLFSMAGVVYMNRHELDLNKIRGFGRGKPLLLFVFLMAALGICGLPFWSGYISKTLLHLSIVEGIDLYRGLPLESPLRLLDGIFIFSGLLTVAYMKKLLVVLFIERGEMTAPKEHYISRPSAVALAVCAALLPIMGCFPVIMDAIADWGGDFFHGHAPVAAVHYFAWKNFAGAVMPITIGTAVYYFLVRTLLMRRGGDNTPTYADRWPKWLDLENLIYRPLLKLLVMVAVFFAHVAAFLPDVLYLVFLRRIQSKQEKPAIIGRFSMDLLLVGIGICIALIYLFSQAFG